MMRIVFKMVMWAGAVGVSAYFAIGHVPFLKARVIEIVNPRIKEARLLDQLNESIQEIGGFDDDTAVAVQRMALDRAKSLVSEIIELNSGSSDLPKAILERAAQIILPLTPFSVPVASSPASPANPATSPPPCIVQ